MVELNVSERASTPAKVMEAVMDFFKVHHHKFQEHVGALCADVPGGPKTFHEIWWECDCGKPSSFASRQAKRRAERVDGN